MADSEAKAIDPAKVTMTKTYSITLERVGKVREMAEGLETSAADILGQAIDRAYEQYKAARNIAPIAMGNVV